MRSVLAQLKGSIDKIFDWFKKIFLKGNVDKCHLITSSKTPVGIEVSNINVMGEEKVKLLELNFDYQISQLCKKACSNSGFQIHQHFTTQINCKCFHNVSVLILSFNLDVSQPSYGTQNKQNS